MGIRIQPRPVEIPADDPFKHDLLDRKESAEALTNLLRNMDGPCVLAVDAGWGTGKTTFLRMWSQHLRNDGFKTVELNAWETDFTDDPFLAISSEITNQLEDSENQSLRDRLVGAKTAAAQVARRTIPAVIRAATAGVLDLSPLIEKEIGQTLASVTEDGLASFAQKQASFLEFRESLEALAQGVATASEERPLVIMIDELDRCRPNYAIELLEAAKHLFSVDHVVFVLAINREQLAHSIKAVYGSGFDSDEYLRRFFDVDFRLRVPNRSHFIWAIIDGLRIENYFERTTDRTARQEFHEAKRLLTSFLDNSGLGLRTIEQALHRFGLLFGSLRSDTRVLGIAAAVVLIIRTIDTNLYRQFIRGEIEDSELADAIFPRAGLTLVRSQPEAWLFEAALIVGGLKVKGVEALHRGPESSSLWRRYKDISDKEQADKIPLSRRHHSATHILQNLSNLFNYGSTYKSNDGMFHQSIGYFGFGRAYERLELFANDLIEVDSAKDQIHEAVGN